MDYCSKSPEPRDQLVLFPTRLDEVIEANHAFRLLDEVLGLLDWSIFEVKYDGGHGRPPIPPRVLASVTLYGLMTRIRSSRSLEESLRVRLDFRWLAEGRTIDHTTLSEFRRKHGEALKNLFVQVGLVARKMGLLPLEQLAYDGTRLRANNRRKALRTPAQLRELRKELAGQFDEQAKRLAEEDARESEVGANGLARELPADLASRQRRLAQVDAALKELKRVEDAGETVPRRIPLTDPQSRETPNKDGGYAPNYTPLATVDCQHGFIVGCDVIAMTNEEHFLVSQIKQVQSDFDLPTAPPEVLADGSIGTGANLAELQEMQVTLYSPAKMLTADENPALRSDVTQPVAEVDWDRLPTMRAPRKQVQLSKEAFVYDAERDCYWCPQGKPLPRKREQTQKRSSVTRKSTLYKANAENCAACLLRGRCLREGSKQRHIERSEHELVIEQLKQRMSTPEGLSKYERRRHAAETPFAVIKHRFGARRFLLRGIEQVRTEWRWLVTAFNLSRLLTLWPSRAGPNRIIALQGCRG